MRPSKQRSLSKEILWERMVRSKERQMWGEVSIIKAPGLTPSVAKQRWANRTPNLNRPFAHNGKVEIHE